MAFNDSLIAYYKMDETGTGTRADSLNGYTLTNGNAVNSSAGKINNGVAFVAASAQRLYNTSIPLATGSAPFSVSGWVRGTATTLQTAFIITKTTIDNSRWNFEIYTNTTTGFLGANLSYVNGTNLDCGLLSSVNVNDGALHHVAVTCFNTTVSSLSLWIDNKLIGTAVGTATYSLPTDFQHVQFGEGRLYTTPESFYRPLDGFMDEWGIWTNYSLTSANVDTLYKNGKGNQYPFLFQKNLKNTLRPKAFAPGLAR